MARRAEEAAENGDVDSMSEGGDDDAVFWEAVDEAATSVEAKDPVKWPKCVLHAPKTSPPPLPHTKHSAAINLGLRSPAAPSPAGPSELAREAPRPAALLPLG